MRHSIMERALRRLKHYATRLIQRSPVSSKIFGPPKAVVDSTLQWVARHRTRGQPPATYRELLPETRLNLAPPRTTEAEVHWKFRERYQIHQPALFVATLPRGRVWGKTGAVITPDDRLLGDVSREFGRTLEDHSVFQQLKLASVKKIVGKVAVLTTAGSEVYFHWMFDVLPRIHLLRLAGVYEEINSFILSGTEAPFQRESLALLGIAEEKVIHSLDHWKFHLEAEILVIPSLPALLDTVSAWSCAFLRKTFLGDRLPKSSARKRLYVSRRHALGRRVINEEAVVRLLTPLGFEVITTEAMTVVEQADLFASAGCVVAPHGAGLTNLVFCSPATKVIDVFAPGWVNPCYWILSRQLKLEYHYLIGEGQRPAEYHDPASKGEDIVVNPEALASLLEMAGIR